jgi:hypothetical protein
MKTYPSKFLYPDLIKFFDGKPSSMVCDCVRILSKMNILDDPGS